MRRHLTPAGNVRAGRHRRSTGTQKRTIYVWPFHTPGWAGRGVGIITPASGELSELRILAVFTWGFQLSELHKPRVGVGARCRPCPPSTTPPRRFSHKMTTCRHHAMPMTRSTRARSAWSTRTTTAGSPTVLRVVGSCAAASATWAAGCSQAAQVEQRPTAPNGRQAGPSSCQVTLLKLVARSPCGRTHPLNRQGVGWDGCSLVSVEGALFVGRTVVWCVSNREPRGSSSDPFSSPKMWCLLLSFPSLALVHHCICDSSSAVRFIPTRNHDPYQEPCSVCVVVNVSVAVRHWTRTATWRINHFHPPTPP